MDIPHPIAYGKSLGEQAYEALRDSIVTLQLKPGQLIYENELADQLRISRTPIRDAFKLLLAERLVEVMPQRNKRVAYISESKVKEIGFVRLSLESSAFRLAARQWDSSPRHAAAERSLRSVLEEQREAAESQDVTAFLRHDEAFHRMVLQLAGNETLLDVVYQLRGHLNRFRYLAMRELELTPRLIEEHEALLEGLRLNDEEAVARLLERHLGKLDADFANLRRQFPDFFTD